MQRNGTNPTTRDITRSAAIDDVNGRQVGLNRTREWTRSLDDVSMFGPRSIKIVNELDHCSKAAQNMLLTYLERGRKP